VKRSGGVSDWANARTLLLGVPPRELYEHSWRQSMSAAPERPLLLERFVEGLAPCPDAGQ